MLHKLCAHLMEAIKDTLQNLMRTLKNKKKLSKDDPQALLPKVLSKKELGHIKFNYFKKGILGISVDSSSWAYHLNLKKEGLLAKLGKKLSGLKDIRFQLGEIKCPAK